MATAAKGSPVDAFAWAVKTGDVAGVEAALKK